MAKAIHETADAKRAQWGPVYGDQWLEALDTLTADLANVSRLLPGHGAPGGLELFTAQRQYLLYYREAIRRLSGGASVLDDDAKAEPDRLLQAFLPDAPLTWMIGLGADAVAAELAHH